MHDELREGGVERMVGEGQVLRRGTPDVDAGVPRTRSLTERLRRIGGGDRLRSEPPDELGGQRSRPAPDIERRLPGVHTREVGQRRCK